MEMKLFLLDFAQCENCQSVYTHHFCAEVSCLLYLCEKCWLTVHSNRGLLYHKPMLKERCKMKAQNAEQTSEHVLNATFLQHQKQKKYWQRHQQQQYEQKQLMQEKNHAYYPTKRFQVNNRDR